MEARIGLFLSSTDDDRTQVKKNFNNTVRRIQQNLQDKKTKSDQLRLLRPRVEEALRRYFPVLTDLKFRLFYSGMTKCELLTTTQTIKIGVALIQDFKRPAEDIVRETEELIQQLDKEFAIKQEEEDAKGSESNFCIFHGRSFYLQLEELDYLPLQLKIHSVF